MRITRPAEAQETCSEVDFPFLILDVAFDKKMKRTYFERFCKKRLNRHFRSNPI